MAEQNIELWKTKKEASEFLSVSEKTVERLARERKKIAWAIRRRVGKRPEVVYNPEDLVSLKKEQETLEPTIMHEVDATPAHSTGTALVRQQRQDDRPDSSLSVLSHLAAALNKQAHVALTEKLCLTIPEASLFSGLTQSYIRRQIKTGSLPAFQDRGWKVRRCDLISHIDSIDTKSQSVPAPV